MFYRIIYIFLAFHGSISSTKASPPRVPSSLASQVRIGSQGRYSEDLSPSPWISDDIKLGQVSGIAVDPDDNVYVFHRADHVWDESSFTGENIYAKQHLGPIAGFPILIFNSDGKLLNQAGRNMFFLPHGITVDRDFNIWVTDVALHQIMKLPPHSNNVTLVLGEKFVPGRDSKHFCKPTSVAVASNGDFFVSDGYCNSRILKFNSAGKMILEWGRENAEKTFPMQHPRPGQFELYVPHALTLAEDKGLLCVADRENGRIVCYKIIDGSYVSEMIIVMWNRIFSVAYSNGKLFAVIEKNRNMKLPFCGFVLDMTGKIIGQFGSNLNTPHDIAVSSNGSAVYVAEISPFKAWKFKNDKITFVMEDTKNLKVQSEIATVTLSDNIDNVEGLTGAILVTFGCFVFAIGLFMAMLIYSKSRKTVSSDSMRLLSNVNY